MCGSKKKGHIQPLRKYDLFYMTPNGKPVDIFSLNINKNQKNE